MFKHHYASTLTGRRNRFLSNRLLNWSEILASWVLLLLAGMGLLLGLKPGYVWAAWGFAGVDILSALARLRTSQKSILLGLFMALAGPSASAQIHQAGQTTIELSAGALDGFILPGQDNFGVFGALSYGKYRNANSYWKASVHLNQKSYAYDKTMVPVSQWLLEGAYFTRLLGLVNKGWLLNVGGGLAGGYESINQDRGDVQGATLMNRSQWVVGPTLAIEGEYILSGRTMLVLRAQEYYLFRSSITPTRFTLGVGIKFMLNTDSDPDADLK